MQKLVANLLDIYNRTTALDVQAITGEQMINADEALAYGFVDEIE